MKQLRDYQKKSQVILTRDTSGLDASGLGTGKTLTGVERVREIAPGLGHAPRVLVVAPANTQRQWLSLFREQFPSMSSSPRLRLVSTPRSDPESWESYLLKKTHGIYIIGWEAMRGMCPASITIITEEAAERINKARADRRELKKILKRKGTSEEQKEIARQRITECEAAMKIRTRKAVLADGTVLPPEQKTTQGVPPEGWVPKDPGGASRGYGKLTSKAVDQAMKCGDVPPWGRTGTWDMVILDESHRMARRNSMNKTVVKKIKAAHKLAMSNTPAGNKPEGLWSTLNWLWPHLYKSFWAWANMFLVIEDQYVGSGDPVQKIVGEKDPGAIWLDIPCKVRHRTEDVRDQLPDVIERVVEIPMAPEQQRIYDEFADQSLAWIDDHPIGEPLPLSQRIRMRQAALGTLAVTADDPDIELGFRTTAPQPKIDMIKDILTDLPEDESVLVFTHSAKWARMAADSLASAKTYGEVRAWTGALSQKQRDDLKDNHFGRDVRIIVAQLQAIAEGTDGLQHHCSNEIWASPSEDGLINQQARGRLHRDGQSKPVQRWLLHSLNSIDIGVHASLELRREQMRQFYRDKRK